MAEILYNEGNYDRKSVQQVDFDKEIFFIVKRNSSNSQ